MWTVAPLLVLHLVLWRRWREVLRFQLLLDLLILAAVGPAILTGGDLNPVRVLERIPPFHHAEWSENTQYQPTQSDLVVQFHPWWDAARRQLLKGRLPLIAPEIGGGMPLLAHGQVGLWAPVMLPVWVLGPERGTTVMAMWKLELAGLGCFLLFRRRLRLRWMAAAVAGVGWAGTPYLVAWLLVPLAWVTAALPWSWWLALRAVGRRRGWAYSIAAAVVFGWLMGSGLHPETAAIVSGSALLAAVFASPRRWIRVVVIFAGSGAVALVLAWPTLQAIATSSRAQLTADADLVLQRPPWSLQRALLTQMAVPAVHGRPGRDWSETYPQAPGAVGTGAALIVAAFGYGRRRRHRPVAGAAIACSALGLVLMMRIPPLDSLLIRIPPLDHMTLVRWGVLIPWGVVVLAALALDAGARDGRRSRSVWRWSVVAVLVAVVVAEEAWALPVASLVAVGATVVAAVIVARRPQASVALAVVTIELCLLAVGVNPVADPADRLPSGRIVSFLQQRAESTGDRVIGIARVLPPNLASRYGLADLRASDPVRPVPFARLMRVMGEPETILGGPLKHLPAGLVGAWGVRWAVTPPGRTLGEPWQARLEEREGRVYENPLVLPEIRVVGKVRIAPDGIVDLRTAVAEVDFRTTALVEGPGLTVDAGQVAWDVVRNEPDGVTVEATCNGPCLLVVSRPWAPGWAATVDGTRATIVVADVAGLGVPVPQGRHAVRLDYTLRPPGFTGFDRRDEPSDPKVARPPRDAADFRSCGWSAFDSETAGHRVDH
jgi:hypothetical protein